MSEESATAVERIGQEYSRYRFRKVVFIAACAVLVFALFFVSLAVGSRALGVSDVYGLFLDHLKGAVYERGTQIWYDDRIIWDYRVPRALFAIIAGAGLAVAGAVMQSVMRNPLADPYTTGISSGALFGVAVGVILGFTMGGAGIQGFGISVNAMVFAMVPMMVIVSMSAYFRKSPSSLILAGVAISYLFSSATSLLMVTTSEEDMATVYRWQVGNFTDLTWDSLPLMFSVCLVGSAIVLALSHKLNLMALDDKDATALGLNGDRLRVVCLIILSIMAASVIAYVGVIGFVGLIVPHMVRMVIGSDNRYVIPGSIAFGAFFLLACDIVARSIDVNASVPVGVVTSLIGAPVFLYLIVRQKSGVWRWPRRQPTQTPSTRACPSTAGSSATSGCGRRPSPR